MRYDPDGHPYTCERSECHMTIVHMDQNVDASRDEAVIHGITCWYHERFSVLLVVNEGSGLCLLYRKHEVC